MREIETRLVGIQAPSGRKLLSLCKVVSAFRAPKVFANSFSNPKTRNLAPKGMLAFAIQIPSVGERIRP